MTRWLPLVRVLALACALAAPRASAGESTSPRALVGQGESWHYLPGDQPVSNDWTQPTFDDAAWPVGPSGFGYGDDDDATVLDDMKGRFVSLRLRRSFTATEADLAVPLTLSIRSDDGFVAWLNGREIARARIVGDPPAADAVASDHEATRVEQFAVPAGLLRAGSNVLAIQAHNSSASSSDFTVEPELLAGAPPPAAPEEAKPDLRPSIPMTPGTTGSERGPVPAPRPGERKRWTSATTAGLSYVSNYFQGRAGSPAEAVWGQVVREELRLRLRTSPWRLGFRVEGNRAGALGISTGAAVRVSRAWGRHDLRVDVDGLWNRPAFRQGDQLATSDSAGLHVSWAFDVNEDITFAAWADATREDLELDPRRDNHDVNLGGSARFFRSHRQLSPEIGVETDRRTAGAPAFEYEQRRMFLRLRSELANRVSLSLMLRYGMRDYATDREDRRRLGRFTCDVALHHGLTLTTFLSWEDGQASTDSRPFESTGAWAGLRWTQ